MIQLQEKEAVSNGVSNDISLKHEVVLLVAYALREDGVEGELTHDEVQRAYNILGLLKAKGVLNEQYPAA